LYRIKYLPKTTVLSARFPYINRLSYLILKLKLHYRFKKLVEDNIKYPTL